VQITIGAFLRFDREGLNHARLQSNESERLRKEDQGNMTRIMERKFRMTAAVGALVIGIREMQEQETTPGHATPGLHHMLLIVIAHGRCTQQLEHTTGSKC
jgi:hypothetical protein